MTKAMFSRVCAYLQTLPSQSKWDDAIAIVYLDAMKDWSDEVVGAIMDHVIKNCEMRPTVARLRTIGIDLFDPKIGFEKVYAEIRRIMNDVPPEKRVAYVDAMIEAGKLKPMIKDVVSRAGGWRWLREQTSSVVQEEVKRAVTEVYSDMDFDHVFVRPQECPALERGRKTLEAIGQ